MRVSTWVTLGLAVVGWVLVLTVPAAEVRGSWVSAALIGLAAAINAQAVVSVWQDVRRDRHG